ncbi:hypothetical protein [Bradyrhizobium sp. 197]|nr:hypothetical protein [Bradyrhizobium sp. 197]
MDCFHGRKLEHHHRSLVVLALEDIDLGAPRDDFAANFTISGTTASRYF